MALIFPDIFRPYVEGREAAIAANWADRDKFEKVRAGQLENLFQGGSLDARLRQEEEKAQALELGNVFSAQTLPTRVAGEEARVGLTQAQTGGIEASTTSELLRQPFIPGREQSAMGLTEAQTRSTVAGAGRTEQLTPSEVRLGETRATVAEQTVPFVLQEAANAANLSGQNVRLATSNANVAEATELEKIAVARKEAEASGLRVDALRLQNELSQSMNPLQVQQVEQQLINLARSNRIGEATTDAEINRIIAGSNMTVTQGKIAALELAFQQETDPVRRRMFNDQARILGTQADVETLTSQYKVMATEANARMAKVQADMAEELKGVNIASAEAQLIRQKYENEIRAIELEYNKNNLSLRQFERRLDIFGRINRGEADPILQRAVKDESNFLWRWWNNDISPVQQYLKLHPELNPMQSQTLFQPGFGR